MIIELEVFCILLLHVMDITIITLYQPSIPDMVCLVLIQGVILKCMGMYLVFSMYFIVSTWLVCIKHFDDT